MIPRVYSGLQRMGLCLPEILKASASRSSLVLQDTPKDSHFRATFLTVSIFLRLASAFSLRRRFESTELDPTHARAQYE